MGLNRGLSPLLILLMLLVTGFQATSGLEHISYTPQLSNHTLEGKITQSTFTLEQPQGQFNNLSMSDYDPIWLVVANSSAIQKFTAPQRAEDTPPPASLPQSGYYLTLRASRLHYQGNQTDRQLRVLRVGNDTTCSPKSQSCNYPLPNSGPYRVKFMVMNSKGPVAETNWSQEIYLRQAQEFQHVPGYRSVGTVVIIALQSIMLAVLFVLVIYTCVHGCDNIPISSPGEQIRMRHYNTHHSG